jgi:outer membrane protein OmpA-like peptidoglycan-associated protein
MPAPRQPTWDDLTRDSGFKSRQDWTLKWWMALAVILTFAFHGAMVWVFENYEIGVTKPEERVVPERIKIDAALLQQQEAIRDIPADLAPVEKASLEKFTPQVDDYDKAAMLPENQDIDLTPNVKEIQNLVRTMNPNEPKGNATAASVNTLTQMLQAPMSDGPSQAEIASAMSAVKSTVLSKPLSSKQLVLDGGNVSKTDARLGAELLESLGEGQGKAASGVKVKGFASLDDVLSGGGAVGGSSGPILMPTDLLFEFGSDQLADGARLSLMKLGFLIQKNPKKLFIIEGHTDAIGSDEANFDLSQRRARAVVDWLQTSLQLGDERVRAVGLGETALLVNGDLPKEEQGLNRRVEIKVRDR